MDGFLGLDCQFGGTTEYPSVLYIDLNSIRSADIQLELVACFIGITTDGREVIEIDQVAVFGETKHEHDTNAVSHFVQILCIGHDLIDRVTVIAFIAAVNHAAAVIVAPFMAAKQQEDIFVLFYEFIPQISAAV